MKNLTNNTITAAIVVALGLVVLANEAQARVVLASHGPRYHRAPSHHEFIFEGGLAEPMGDQKDNFWNTETGFGSGTGYQLGARIRQYVGESFAVSPAFHYTRFGSDSGVTDYDNQTNLGYNIRTSNYRFGVDFQGFMGHGGEPARLFLSGGVALVNNRLRDEIQDNGYFIDTVNTPAFSVGMGIKMQNIEIAGEYTYNRFDSRKFSTSDVTESYNWDYLVVRVGLSFGR